MGTGRGGEGDGGGEGGILASNISSSQNVFQISFLVTAAIVWVRRGGLVPVVDDGAGGRGVMSCVMTNPRGRERAVLDLLLSRHRLVSNGYRKGKAEGERPGSGRGKKSGGRRCARRERKEKRREGEKSGRREQTRVEGGRLRAMPSASPSSPISSRVAHKWNTRRSLLIH